MASALRRWWNLKPHRERPVDDTLYLGSSARKDQESIAPSNLRTALKGTVNNKSLESEMEADEKDRHIAHAGGFRPPFNLQETFVQDVEIGESRPTPYKFRDIWCP
ncbi:hypothetical protein AXG93_3310s1050 [Marchantia polymorpha subsp. ruderalis]|uniref:Uncharacterized protein n=1 Tax=Marchantia polymorpha subsp. ruderalis TaxID=1480154 RepID=A0A176W3F8_MARPO|nr:hypothetical protein AXG93_3310s1050 [Marchantia polymorpha subsp. ruderalis]